MYGYFNKYSNQKYAFKLTYSQSKQKPDVMSSPCLKSMPLTHLGRDYRYFLNMNAVFKYHLIIKPRTNFYT